MPRPQPARSGRPRGPCGPALSLDQDTLLRARAEDVVRRLPDGCLDLIYLDPPFGTGTARKVLSGRNGRFGLGSLTAFEDPRPDGSRNGAHPLSSWLSSLLVECLRLLRPGGALFLHLDYRNAHRARCLLDDLFGAAAFRNEIIWHYATGGIPRRWFARKHDTILYYCKAHPGGGPGQTFHRLTEKKYLAHRMCRRGVPEFQDERGWYRYRTLDDVWEIPWLTADAKERTGYPSQKPVALLERILQAATNPGDRVADFCCGSGTTAVAARRLNRRWIACDASPVAIRVARRRLA